MFKGLANTVQNHSKAIILAWLVVLIASFFFAVHSGDVLIYDMTEMSGSDSESSEGSAIMNEYFTNSLDVADIVVVSYENAEQRSEAALLYDEFSRLVGVQYGDRVSVSDYGQYSRSDEGDGICLIAVANNDETLDITHETDELRALLSEAKKTVGATNRTYVTGNAAITYDTEASSMEDVSKVDPLSIAFIFILLGLFFCALVTALVPPAVVGMAYAIVLMLMFFVGSVIDIFYITQVLILIAMLGAGCDYAIFIITRYRDERKKGKSHEEALREAIVWGGEAVFTSGISVIIGFAALALCDFSMVQTMGLILALGIAVALFAALTFIPSLLNLVGEKIFWPSNIEMYKQTEVRAASEGKKGFRAGVSSISKRYFGWLADFTQRRAVAIVAILLIAAVPTIYEYAQAEDSADMISVMPASESVDGLNAIMEQTDGGMIMPTHVVIDLGYSIGSVGSLPFMGTNVPFVIWNYKGLVENEAGFSGAVKDIMDISSDIGARHQDIVGTVSGTSSWYVIYSNVADSIGTTDPKAVNLAAVSAMPDIVKDGVLKILAIASGQDPSDPDPYNLTVMPDDRAFGTPLTVANFVDGILNYSTGIIDGSASHVAMMIITSQQPMSDDTMSFITDLKEEFHGENGYDSVYADRWNASYVTGTAALMNDIADDVGEQFSMIRVVVSILLIILLFVILGSYLTPIRAILTILFSVILSVSLTNVLFVNIMGTPVLFLVPIVLFVVLLGLGMDYEIFLTTKIRENRSKGMDNHDAISQAIRDAGPVITLCALLMGGTFLTLTLAGSSMLQEFGFALGVGILIDGLLMVGFVSPAMMHLMGDWSWKGPGFLTRRHGMNPDGTLIRKEE